jgi:hypothetical protein
MRKENFSKMVFNPFEISDDVLMTNAEGTKLYDLLGADQGIMSAHHMHTESKAKRIRYILYMYDKGSPLWQTDPDVISRKKKAASLAGFDILSERDNVLEQLFLLSDKNLAKSVSSFVRYQNSPELSTLISNEQVLYELQHVLREQLLDFKDDKQKIDHFKTKIELLEKQDRVLGLINKYKEQIWGGDDPAFEQTMELEFNRKTSPEQIALIQLKTPVPMARPNGPAVLR